MEYGDYDTFAFAVNGLQETVVCPEEDPRWAHYAFVNNNYLGRLFSYKHGYLYTSIEGKAGPIPSCNITKGE